MLLCVSGSHVSLCSRAHVRSMLTPSCCVLLQVERQLRMLRWWLEACTSRFTPAGWCDWVGVQVRSWGERGALGEAWGPEGSGWILVTGHALVPRGPTCPGSGLTWHLHLQPPCLLEVSHSQRPCGFWLKCHCPLRPSLPGPLTAFLHSVLSERVWLWVYVDERSRLLASQVYSSPLPAEPVRGWDVTGTGRGL